MEQIKNDRIRHSKHKKIVFSHNFKTLNFFEVKFAT